MPKKAKANTAPSPPRRILEDEEQMGVTYEDFSARLQELGTYATTQRSRCLSTSHEFHDFVFNQAGILTGGRIPRVADNLVQL